MTFRNLLTTFCRDEDGAVTVDWVVLTAACVGLGVAVLGAITNGTPTATGTIAGHLDGTSVSAAVDTTAGGGTDTAAADGGS